ncbi:hypothetical protein ACQP2E_20790 [Actinoplanes sp. CA-015351]|uniref:hypothetical protein n=1 Tax=Actinoplanes sp. CA-015351 TaxID=3239897 RepID=UPI003D954271
MTDAYGSRRIRCPLCLNWIDWDRVPSVVIDETGAEQPVTSRPADPALGANEKYAAVRRCPHSSPPHYLPDQYGAFGEPIVVGVVGNSLVGKTHLLAAMVGQMQIVTKMDALGLEVRPLDPGIHLDFQRNYLEPFLNGRRQLRATAIEDPNALTYAVQVFSRRSGRAHALAFFDVSGEQLIRAQGNAFIQAVDALLFVVDAANVPPFIGNGNEVPPDSTFEAVLTRLERQFFGDQHAGGGFVPLPAALVVAKADRLEFDAEAPLRRWFSHDDDLDLSTVEDESEDVYAFLSTRGAGAWLSPVHRCLDVSLHYTSATNCEPDGDTFPRERFRQRRVFKPLLTLLAKKNVALGEVP